MFDKVLKKCLHNSSLKIVRGKSKSSGFTLIEVLVTIIIVGILSAIAAPSWLGFVARQRLNKANDIVLAALREAQREAKKTKLSYSVSFKTDTDGEPQIAVYQGTTPSNWRSLGAEIEVKPKTILLGTNLQHSNDAKDNVNDISYGDDFDATKPQTITFNYLGIMDRKTDGNSSDTDLKVLLAIPKVNNPTEASGVKRCVIVKTLIGGIQTAKDDDCT